MDLRQGVILGLAGLVVAASLATDAFGSERSPVLVLRGGYGHCVPFCVDFKRLGEPGYALAVDAGGTVLAASPLEGVAETLLPSIGLAPMPPPHSGVVDLPEVLALPGCATGTPRRLGIETRSWRTTTQTVVQVTARVYCDFELVEVGATVLRVRDPVIGTT